MRTDVPIDDLEDTIPAEPANAGWLAELEEQHGLGGSVQRICDALKISR